MVAAVGLGIWIPKLDQRLDDRLATAIAGNLYSGGAEAARAVLSAIAGSLITVTSLTFSLTVVTLQLASSQFSPRLLRTFSRDRVVHGTLAALLGTFTYTLTVLSVVRAERSGQPPFVPRIAVTLAYLLALASVLALVGFLAHLARQLRIESMLLSVHVDSAETIRRTLPEAAPAPAALSEVLPPAAGGTILCARSSGFLASVDEVALLRAAVRAEAVVLIDRPPGDSVIAGTPVGMAWSLNQRPLVGPRWTRLSSDVAGGLLTGFERTAAQDIAYGLRQLVDVVVKALSPGINDPTTAVHALSHAAALLCQMARGAPGPRVLRDDSDRVRVVLHRPDLATLLDLVITQPSRYAAGEPQVLARLLTLLREVAWSATGDQASAAVRDQASPAVRDQASAAVRDQLGRLRTVVGRGAYDPAEQDLLDARMRLVEEALAGHWPLATGSLES